MRAKTRTLQRNISFPLPTVEGIEALADAQGVTFSDIVRVAVNDHLVKVAVNLDDPSDRSKNTVNK